MSEKTIAKKIQFATCILLACASWMSAREESQNNSDFMLAFTSGYVFKPGDKTFQNEYGHGIVNIITTDLCYQAWDEWGIGAKLSYWRAKNNNNLAQQVPLTFYLRRYENFDCGLQAYASLGGGVIWSQDTSDTWLRKNDWGQPFINSYFAKMLGEFETGFNYHIWNRIHLTGAVRYLFPQQLSPNVSVMRTLGGIDLRAGLSFDF